MINVVCSVLDFNSKVLRNLELINNSEHSKSVNFILKSASEVDVDIIKKYSFVTLICKSDTGIYDAWNQSLYALLDGWVIFLGDDDYLSDAYLSFAFSISPSEHSCIVSDVSLEFESGEVVGVYPAPVSDILPTKNNNFSHPGTFFSRDIYTKKFSTDYKIISDYIYYSHMDITIAARFSGIGTVMTQGGVSNEPRNVSAVLREFLKATYRREVPLNLKFIGSKLFSLFLTLFPDYIYKSIRRSYWKCRNIK